jgi:integrase/recombinase XerD
MSYDEQAENYRKYLQTLGYAPKSIKTKERQIKEFFSYLETQGMHKTNAIQSIHISAYQKNHLENRPNKTNGGALAGCTIYGHMANINTFFTMLQNQGAISIHPCSTLVFKAVKSRTERTILTQQEIKELYEHTVTMQERAILSLAYGCGLRSGEIEKLNTQDIKLREGIVIVVSGKGNKRRTIPLSKGVLSDLSQYYYTERTEQAMPEEKAYLLHLRGGRMKEYTLNKILRRIIKRTANKDIEEQQISMHHLRHSIATHLLEQGVPLEKVRLFLGHSLLETTQIYTRVSAEQLKKII